MKFIKYDNIQDFAKDNLDLILEKEWLNNLMVGNVLEGLEKNIGQDWILAKVDTEKGTELIMLHRLPWNLLLYSPTNNLDDELYKFAAQEYYKIEPNLNGLNAERALVDKFAKYFTEIASKQIKPNYDMRILLLQKVNEANLLLDVIFREARREEIPILIEYLRDFQKEALGENIETDVIKERIEDYFKKGYYVLEVDGKIVSQAVISRALTKGKTVSEVYTPKEYRGKGYAYNLVYKITEKCMNEGCEYCVLYTDDHNPISNHVYEKIGYIRQVDTKDIKLI